MTWVARFSHFDDACGHHGHTLLEFSYVYVSLLVFFSDRVQRRRETH